MELPNFINWKPPAPPETIPAAPVAPTWRLPGSAPVPAPEVEATEATPVAKRPYTKRSLAPEEKPFELMVTAELQAGVRHRRKALAEAEDPSTVPEHIYLTAENLLTKLSPPERLLRATFVEQFFFDFNPVLAAVRLGYSNEREDLFSASEAENVAKKLMAEPVVQRLIREYTATSISDEQKKDWLIAAAMREACSQDSSGQVRIQALKLLGELTGCVAHVPPSRRPAELPQIPDKKGAEVEQAPTFAPTKGGVLVLPPVPSMDDWERQAMLRQRQLRDSIGV